MRASEILRNLADLIDNAEGSQDPSVTPQQAAHGQAPMSKFTPDTQEPEVNANAGVFVPPLQAKIELLKKAVDVDNIYDKGGDELAQIKKHAGIHPVVADEASSDEPLDV